MSGLAALFNVPENDQQRAQWAFAHSSHHRDILRLIYQRVTLALPEYILDPINPEDTGQWAAQHQEMHTQMDAILGIKGFNLEDVNWKNRGELASWIQLHANEHYQAASILGIG